jgi:hypothetical protein
VDSFIDKFSAFQLEDELPLQEGREVMYDRTYSRRRRARDIRRGAERAASKAAGRAVSTTREHAAVSMTYEHAAPPTG